MPTVLGSILGSLTFWSAMAIATLWVFLVVRARGRRQREEWKSQERQWRGDDPEEDDDTPDDANVP